MRTPLEVRDRFLSRTRARSAAAAIVVALTLTAATIVSLGWLQRSMILDADQVSQDELLRATLTSEASVGQTFVARHDGLTGIEFYLEPPSVEPHDVALTLHLQPLDEETPAGEGVDLVTAALYLTAGAQPGFYRFTFPPVRDSHSVYYHAFLEASHAGVDVALAGGASYLDGAAYQAHEPLEAQTTFRLVYQPTEALFGALSALVVDLRWLLATAFLFVVPGWALLAWLGPRNRLSWAETVGLAAGIGLALYPLLFLWTDLIGVHFGGLYAWLLPGAGLIALAVRYRNWRPGDGSEAGLGRRWLRPGVVWPNIALVAVLALLWGVRFVAAHGLEAPMWGDGYQHTMIAQLLVDNGGLFDSWAPYAEINTFTYHFGFHSAVAVFHWLTRLPVVESTLWIGQMLNGLAVVALYPLALRITRSPWASVWAVLLAGLLSPMPMFYVNWGRYTQLAGQVILPAVVWLTWEIVDPDSGQTQVGAREPGKHRHWRLGEHRHWRLAFPRGRPSGKSAGLLALVATGAAGLALTHYRVLLFYGAFVALVVLFHLGNQAGKAPALAAGKAPALAHTWGAIRRLAAAGVGGALLFLPWLVHTFAGNTPQFFGQQLLTPPSQAHSFMTTYNAVGDLGNYLAPLWWLALFLGLGVGLWQRQRPVVLAGAWWALLLLVANPAWLSLPGTGVVTNTTLFLATYLPAALLSGFLFGRAVSWAETRLLRWRLFAAGTQSLGISGWFSAGLALALIVLGCWGARQRLRDPRPDRHALVTRPDVRAAAWIQAETGPEARFLVNSFLAYGGGTVVGSDGGWWLPLLARRTNTVPPLNYVSEWPLGSGYREDVLEVATQVQEQGVTDPATVGRLRQAGITHVYVGQRQGRVNYAGPAVLQPGELLASRDYALVYHRDRVWVFALTQGPGTGRESGG